MPEEHESLEHNQGLAHFLGRLAIRRFPVKKDIGGLNPSLGAQVELERNWHRTRLEIAVPVRVVGDHCLHSPP